MTEKLMTAIIKHDTQSYINANNKEYFTNKQTEVIVKNFIITIRDDDITIYPKS